MLGMCESLGSITDIKHKYMSREKERKARGKKERIQGGKEERKPGRLSGYNFSLSFFLPEECSTYSASLKKCHENK